MELKIVTGMSGAGKTNFVQVLEDMGYYCVDNLPPNLFSKFVELILQVQSDYDKVALVADVRGGKFFQDVTRVLQELKNKGLKSGGGIRWPTSAACWKAFRRSGSGWRVSAGRRM